MLELLEQPGSVDLPLSHFVPRWRAPDQQPGSCFTHRWFAHAAFANDLISAIRPHLLLELGTEEGESYFSLCQAIAENGLSCLCYAVTRNIAEEARQYNASTYGGFSYILDEKGARSQFRDESLDLLHIRGNLTYEAVREHVDAWLPKLRPAGLLLLDGIAVRSPDCGAWRVWEEITAPQKFAFHHAGGLGVLRAHSASQERQPFLDLLFHTQPETQERLRRHYAIYASYLENTARATLHAEAVAQARAAADEEVRSIRTELRAAQAERILLSAELAHMTAQHNDAVRKLQQSEQLAAELAKKNAAFENAHKDELDTLRTKLEFERALRGKIETSVSWRVTAPLRRIMSILRGTRT